jgi:ABC-type phosphate/phosphonate transport system permease subunit
LFQILFNLTDFVPFVIPTQEESQHTNHQVFSGAIFSFPFQSVIAKNEAISLLDCFVPRNDTISIAIWAIAVGFKRKFCFIFLQAKNNLARWEMQLKIY